MSYSCICSRDLTSSRSADRVLDPGHQATGGSDVYLTVPFFPIVPRTLFSVTQSRLEPKNQIPSVGCIWNAFNCSTPSTISAPPSSHIGIGSTNLLARPSADLVSVMGAVTVHVHSDHNFPVPRNPDSPELRMSISRG